jgi:hypothetical protein
MNYKHRHLNQKGGKPYKHKINGQPKNYFHATKIKTLKNFKRIKYQPTREENPVCFIRM